MGIYIGQMWRQIIFAQFIESNSRNFALEVSFMQEIEMFS